MEEERDYKVKEICIRFYEEKVKELGIFIKREEDIDLQICYLLWFEVVGNSDVVIRKWFLILFRVELFIDKKQ